MITVTVGQTTTRKGHKVHQHRNGWATCGSGRIINTHQITESDAGRICKRCADKLRPEICMDRDDAARITRDQGCQTYATACNAVIDSMLDAGEEALLARLIADMTSMYA
jgi:hypothetical protein